MVAQKSSKHPRKKISILICLLVFILSFIQHAVGSLDDEYKMQKQILFLEQKQEEANKTVNVSFPEPENEISVFGWVKPSRDDFIPHQEVLIFAMQPQLTGLPTQQYVEENLFLFSFILHGSCGHFGHRKNGQPITLVEPYCDLEFQGPEQGEWFFFYVGHSPDLQQTNIFLRLRSRMYTRLIQDTLMNKVYDVSVSFEYLDPQQFVTLKGIRQRFAVGFGKGAYTEISLNALSSLHPNQYTACANFFEDNIYSFNYAQVCLRNTIILGQSIKFSCVNVPPGEGVVYVQSEDGESLVETQYKQGYTCFQSIQIKQAYYSISP